MLIIYVYLKTVPTFIYQNRVRVKINNINEYYKLIRGENVNERSNILDSLTIEEMFIFVMGLSGKKVDENLYELYNWYISKYNIDTNKVTEIVNNINQKYQSKL